MAGPEPLLGAVGTELSRKAEVPRRGPKPESWQIPSQIAGLEVRGKFGQRHRVTKKSD